MSKEPEWKTRRDRVNKKLTSLNPPWTIIPYHDSLDTSQLQHHAVEEYPTAHGPADYALFVKGQLLGIIEAKKVSLGTQEVLAQAKRYAKGAFEGIGNWRGYRVPFLYSSNGELVYFLDVRDGKNISRQIANFHTPDALAEFMGRDHASSKQWLQDNPVSDNSKLRPYQEDAIAFVELVNTLSLRHG